MSLWLRIVLFASLAFNLLVVGLVAGVVLNGGPPARGGDPEGRIPMVRALEEEARRDLRRDLRKSFAKERREGAPGLRGRAAYRQMLQALRAEPFDAEAVRAVMDAQNAAANRRFRQGQTALLERIEAMSAEERAVYAARLEEILSKPRRKDKGDRKE